MSAPPASWTPTERRLWRALRDDEPLDLRAGVDDGGRAPLADSSDTEVSATVLAALLLVPPAICGVIAWYAWLPSVHGRAPAVHTGACVGRRPAGGAQRPVTTARVGAAQPRCNRRAPAGALTTTGAAPSAVAGWTPPSVRRPSADYLRPSSMPCR